MVDARIQQTRLDTRAAYGIAGRAVVAAHFGVRFGALSLARPFALDLPRKPERARLLTILYAGHVAETIHANNRHRGMIAGQSPHFLALRGVLVQHVGAIDERDAHTARLAGSIIIKQSGNWAATETLASRLATGELLGYWTARRIIRGEAASQSDVIAAD